MSFRFKLVVLVAGATVLPVLLSLFLFYLRGLNAERAGRQPPSQFLRMMNWIDEQLPEAWQAGAPQAALNTLPPGQEVIVVDSEGRTILSSTPGFPAGELDGAGRFYRELVQGKMFRVATAPVVVGGRAVGEVIQRLPGRPSRSSRAAMRLEGPLGYMAIVVVAATFMIFLVTSSLRQGIARLEAATARVASGDLDFQLEVRGKDEIAALSSSFESMRRALKEEEARHSRFLMAVSHDLKTPLTSIKGYLEAIEDGLAEDPRLLHDYVGIMGAKTKVLEGRINELIDYVKMATGQWQLKHRPIRLRRFLGDLAKTFASDAQVFKREFRHRIELPEDACLPGDEGLLGRALDNLFHNALRYTREGDTIRLLARQEGGQVVIVFEDNGPGVAESELERIFEPFYRGTESRREAGTGLGLSIVRSILDAHGWSIRAGKAAGSGLALTIRAGNPRSCDSS
jgi:signal transduction histidine kinase